MNLPSRPWSGASHRRTICGGWPWLSRLQTRLRNAPSISEPASVRTGTCRLSPQPSQGEPKWLRLPTAYSQSSKEQHQWPTHSRELPDPLDKMRVRLRFAANALLYRQRRRQRRSAFGDKVFNIGLAHTGLVGHDRHLGQHGEAACGDVAFGKTDQLPSVGPGQALAELHIIGRGARWCGSPRHSGRPQEPDQHQCASR